MHVAALSLDLHLPHAHSLKEKRAVIKPIVEGCQRRFRVAAIPRQHRQRRTEALVDQIFHGALGRLSTAIRFAALGTPFRHAGFAAGRPRRG